MQWASRKNFCVKTHDCDLAWAGINLFLSLILWSKSLALMASLVDADVAGFLNDFPNLAFFCNPLDPIHWKYVIRYISIFEIWVSFKNFLRMNKTWVFFLSFCITKKNCSNYKKCALRVYAFQLELTRYKVDKGCLLSECFKFIKRFGWEIHHDRNSVYKKLLSSQSLKSW